MRAPFPYFGGKRRAAHLIWAALGDPGGYVEPFCGSAAVLLNRPGWEPGGRRRVETLNDADGWLVNTWRAIRGNPAAVADACAGPVTEIDYHARLAWLQDRRGDDLVSWLEGDPEVYDARAAGWWLYVAACSIGNPWDPGPWRVVDGRLVKTTGTGQGVQRELPHLGDAGQGIATAAAGELQRLAQRLAHVRITCGHWERVLTPSPLRATAGNPITGVLLDPPYDNGDTAVYHHPDHTGTLSAAAREWALTAPPDLRIVICGYGTEHDALLTHGWRAAQGRGGQGNGYSKTPGTAKQERLWISPACHDPEGRLF